MQRGLSLLLICCAAQALANDTTASTGAGGIEIRRTDAIDMVSEDLFVSVDRIEVKYVFRNRTAADVDTIVAFPMPPRDLGKEYGGDVGYPSDFRTTVDGKPVKPTRERKATVGTIDHRPLLDQLKIPVAPESINEAVAAMDRLPAPQRRKLVELGLAGEEEWDNDGKGMKKHLIPLWTVRDIWWSRQRFPRGRPVRIDHRYIPGVGGSTDTALRYKRYRDTPDGRRVMAKYCTDRDFIAALDRAGPPETVPGMPEYRVDYILRTGANWRSPIGSFRLVVDKGKPTNLVSFCGQGVRKLSPTRFELTHRNWRPTGDLHVLIVERGTPAAQR